MSLETLNVILDEVAQVGIAVGRAGLAEVVRCRGGERLKALDDVAAARTYVVPLHVQQTDLACVEEQLDHARLVAALLLGEANRVHPNDIAIVGGADEGFERVEDVASLGQARREFVDLSPRGACRRGSLADLR